MNKTGANTKLGMMSKLQREEVEKIGSLVEKEVERKDNQEKRRK